MDIRDAVIGICNEVVATNKNWTELAKYNRRLWRKQNRINKYFGLSIISSVMYIYVSERHYKEQNKQIEKLTKELKEVKGE